MIFDIFPKEIVYGFLCLVGIILIIVILHAIVKAVNKHLNYYPNMHLEIDITGKRNMTEEILIGYCINGYEIEEIEHHIQFIEKWKADKITSFKGKHKKIDKFKERCEINKEKAFTLVGYRVQTKYRQYNYVRTPYKDSVVYYSIPTSIEDIKKYIAMYKK